MEGSRVLTLRAIFHPEEHENAEPEERRLFTKDFEDDEPSPLDK